MITRHPRFDRTFRGSISAVLFYVLVGPIVWAFHLTLIYGAHTLVCTRTPSGGASAALVVLAATALALVAILAALAALNAVRRRGGEDGSLVFCHRVATLLAWLSAFGVACAGATVLFIEPCLALR